jgi:hypothetical protein
MAQKYINSLCANAFSYLPALDDDVRFLPEIL